MALKLLTKPNKLPAQISSGRCEFKYSREVITPPANKTAKISGNNNSNMENL